MEGLSRVHDGDKKETTNGYDVLNIIVATEKDQGLQITPIVSKLFSYRQEVDTIKNILFDQLISIIIGSNNRGVFIFDRGYDDKKMYSFFHEHSSSFIIRSKGVRDLYFNGQKQKFAQIAKQVELNHIFHCKRKTRKGKETRVFSVKEASVCSEKNPGFRPRTPIFPILIRNPLTWKLIS